LKQPYKQVPVLGGGVAWLPILRIQLSRNDVLTTPFEAIIDSGAHDCLFSADIAPAVGIPDFTTGILKISDGVVKGAQMKSYAHDVRLVIGSDNFKIEAYFSGEMPQGALLGRNGFFDKYVVTFDPRGDEPGFELTRVHQKK
jgi:hypothetical protein